MATGGETGGLIVVGKGGEQLMTVEFREMSFTLRSETAAT